MRYIVVLTGALTVLAAIWLRAERRMSADLTAFWGIIGMLLIIAGAIPPAADWIIKTCVSGSQAAPVIGIVLLAGGLWLSTRFSLLSEKNCELSVEASLMLQENKQLLAELEEIDEKDSFCNQYDGTRRCGAVPAESSEEIGRTGV